MDIQKVVGNNLIYKASNNNRLNFLKLSDLKFYFFFNKIFYISKKIVKKNLNFKINKKFLEILKKKNKILFFSVNFSFFFLFFKLIKTFEFISIFGWIYEVNIKGLGLFCYVEKNLLKMCLGHSHGILYKFDSNILKINVKKNKIFFFGYSKMFLMNFISLFLNLKKINKYKERGLILNGIKIKYKIGKKKKK